MKKTTKFLQLHRRDRKKSSSLLRAVFQRIFYLRIKELPATLKSRAVPAQKNIQIVQKVKKYQYRDQVNDQICYARLE